MEFTAWSLVNDVAIISALLLVGTILRAKVRAIQSLFLPASMIAGFLGLMLGPQVLGLLPFSEQAATYPGVLIAVIFAAIPLGAKAVPWKQMATRVRNMWSYAMILTVLMWGGGSLFALLTLNQFLPELHLGFGLVLGAGFLGGHGTAAAIGESFEMYGWEDAMSLGMTAATIGLLVAVLVGLLLIKHATEKGHTSFISDFKSLPNELKTGMVKSENRKSMGDDTVSNISVDPLILHLALVAAVVGGGYYLTEIGNDLIPHVALPLFSIAFLVALFAKFVMRKTGAEDYIDGRIIGRIGGGATDFLVAFGIATINLSIVADYLTPLAILLVFGLFWAWFIYRFIGPRMFREYWMERSLFGWGWSTGTVAMGLALLRIVDPKMESKTAEDYAIAYIGMVPPELIIVTFAPLLMVSGLHWVFPLATLGVGLIIIIVYVKKGWWVSDGEMKQRHSA
ncbi:ESS family glutamate:Na+ symporter [Salsuginibacillus halophilus]|uniref:ESS family glutamate:Na+ symporter n=1 Tax=Salsuginibacillus halophilus TaxID=517424 RepID=A0A2P8HQI6_9BACI|nr:sodium/glutamate symporter [Salsuginibacillus halophilus]PSL48452.1 ESS family glutamate:Na+ symporter [Salsuginibacillus halophilus]